MEEEILFENEDGEDERLNCVRDIMFDDATCGICLEDYEVGEMVPFNQNPLCIHHFHSKCLLKWLVESGKGNCPCCRRIYKKENTCVATKKP